LPVLEDGYLDDMRASVGVVVPFRYALVNRWYYNATPIPSPRLLARVLWQGRGHAVKVLYNALIRVGRDSAAADRAVLSDLDRQWRQVQLPRYQRLVAAATTEAATAAPERLVDRQAKPIEPESVAERRQRWQHQRALAAPLTLGKPVRVIGDLIDRAAQEARGPATVTAGAIIGHPASAGRATGPVRIVHGPDDFAEFRQGDVFVAKTTAPAWTPLFAKAAAVVTDSGTLAAHASLVAREYGIPAVVGTGDATTRLKQGQTVTVDGTAGTVTTES